jgi:hypothetical protein
MKYENYKMSDLLGFKFTMNAIEYTVTKVENPYRLQCTGAGRTLEVYVAYNNTKTVYRCRLIYEWREVARVFYERDQDNL